MTSEPFELFAVRYAHHAHRTSSENFIGGDPHEISSPLDYFVWVARRSDRVFVIDTGFGPEAARQRRRELLRTPAQGLELLGIEAGQVEDVIITHLHYDHAGTLDAFPRARLHIQDQEVAYATGRCMGHPALRHAYAADDVVALVRRVYAEQVCFHDGAQELTAGLSLHRVGGHTAGLQAVRVRTRRGWVVLASDAAHLYANMERRLPFPIVYNVADMLEGHAMVNRLAESPDHVVPGHDPLVMKRYPAPAPELAGIVVRLDAPPDRARD